mmetsp:Transcript_5482/g.10331  ORF Transcript_5482/g.10331 Transcript_5482/m.10331 type:complete len:304 (-) Transcript_5482:97-1008(-)
MRRWERRHEPQTAQRERHHGRHGHLAQEGGGPQHGAVAAQRHYEVQVGHHVRGGGGVRAGVVRLLPRLQQRRLRGQLALGRRLYVHPQALIPHQERHHLLERVHEGRPPSRLGHDQHRLGRFVPVQLEGWAQLRMGPELVSVRRVHAVAQALHAVPLGAHAHLLSPLAGHNRHRLPRSYAALLHRKHARLRPGALLRRRRLPGGRQKRRHLVHAAGTGEGEGVGVERVGGVVLLLQLVEGDARRVAAAQWRRVLRPVLDCVLDSVLDSVLVLVRGRPRHALGVGGGARARALAHHLEPGAALA